MRPVSRELHGQLNPQLAEIFDVVLHQVLCHQVQDPKTSVAQMAAQRAERVRIYDPEKIRLPISSNPEYKLMSKDMDPQLRETLRVAFECCHNMLYARISNNEQLGWTARSTLGRMRPQVQKELMKNTIPPIVPMLLDVAETISQSATPATWQRELEQRASQRPGPRGA